MTGEYAEVEVLEEHRVIEVRVDGKEEDATRERTLRCALATAEHWKG